VSVQTNGNFPGLCGLDIFLWVFQSPEGRTENSPWASALGKRTRQNRPERAAECRALFPKITFVESDPMALQKLTKLFLIRKFTVMLGLVGNVGGDSLYVRLAH